MLFALVTGNERTTLYYWNPRWLLIIIGWTDGMVVVVSIYMDIVYNLYGKIWTRYMGVPSWMRAFRGV